MIASLMLIIMITLFSVRPAVTGPFILIPLGVMRLADYVYGAVGFAGCWKIIRLSAADRKRRRQGLPLGLPL
ncbi:hypothetical protein AL755_10695 [Arthrobacter sp. ERGS1:01]|nr:hypothetical protein AL755_10695 [Arthrobacter sp. ERGS1:01]